MHISVCTDAVYAGMDTVRAMKQVKASGLRAIEFWTWENKDIAAIDQARRELDMDIVAFCTSYGSLTDPGKRDEYIHGLEESLAVAKRLDCRLLITQVGNKHSLIDGEDHQSIVDGLKRCTAMLEEAGVILMIEPLNTRVDHGGYYLESSDEAREIIDEVASPKVKLLFDFYHQQISEGDILRRSTVILDRIAHFHAAGNPGRHELTVGEINYEAIFAELTKLDYRGYVGLEYMPIGDRQAGLERLRDWA